MFDSDSSSSSSTDKVRKPFSAVKEAASATQRRKLPVNPDLEKEIEHIFSQPAARQDTRKRERKSRYIGKLVESAERRKAEAQRVIEQRIVKEREREDALFEGKERFVTPAYKRKLEENERTRQVEIQEEKEQQPSGRNVSEFYHKLLQSRTLMAEQDDVGENTRISKDSKQNGEDTANEADTQRPSGPSPEYKQAQPTRAEEPHKMRTLFSQQDSDTHAEKHKQGDEPQSTGGVPGVDTEALSKPSIPKKRGLRRNTPETIAAYRQRYFERRARRLSSQKT